MAGAVGLLNIRHIACIPRQKGIICGLWRCNTRLRKQGVICSLSRSALHVASITLLCPRGWYTLLPLCPLIDLIGSNIVDDTTRSCSVPGPASGDVGFHDVEYLQQLAGRRRAPIATYELLHVNLRLVLRLFFELLQSTERLIVVHPVARQIIVEQGFCGAVFGAPQALCKHTYSLLTVLGHQRALICEPPGDLLLKDLLADSVKIA